MSLLRRILSGVACVAAVALLALPAIAKLDEKEWSKAKKDLEAGLAANDSSAISSAVEKLGEDQSKRAVELIVTIGARLDDIRVYESVKKALSTMSEPDAVQAMIGTLKSKSSPNDWTLRCVLVECMGPIRADGVCDAIVKALDDKIPYVTSAAAKSLGKRRDKEAVAGLIKKLGELEKNKDVVWVDVKQALTDITGQDLADAKEWDDFWKVRGKEFDVEKDRGDKRESSTTVRPGEESGEFFREKLLAKRIMFVIDVSGSMEAADIPIEGKGNQKRVEVVKNELIKTVKNLKKDVRFNILAYSTGQPKAWQKIQPGAALVPATDPMKQDAMKWVGALKADGATETDIALKKAFEPVEVNQIILLSDGQPAKFVPGQQQATPIPTDEILRTVQGLNRLRGVKINTFCFAIFQRSPGAEPLLQFMDDLAKQNGGKMILVGGGGLPKPDPNNPPPGGGGNGGGNGGGAGGGNPP